MLLLGKYEAAIDDKKWRSYLNTIQQQWLNKTGYNGLMAKEFESYLKCIQFNFTLLTISGIVRGFGKRQNTDRYYIIYREDKVELFVDTNDLALFTSEKISYDKETDSFVLLDYPDIIFTKATQ